MKKALLRFNTYHDGSKDFWRVIFCEEDNIERLYDSVSINCSSGTTKDVLSDGTVKFHVTIMYDNYLLFRNNTILFR